MQIHRLFEIVYILMDKKNVTAQELAMHFEVSKRTILRDVEALTMAGIPIYTSRGKGGGISILDNFVFNKTTITDKEQTQILVALQSLRTTKQIDVGEIIAKLGALFAKTDTNWLEVDFSRWGNSDVDKEKFETLKQVIIKKLSISFSYSDTSGKTSKREVYPLKLTFKSKAWYLQAYCLKREAYRTFKINRMFEIEILSKDFIEQEFSPPTIESDDLPVKLLHLELQFPKELSYRVYDEFDVKAIHRNKDGSLHVTIDMPEDYWLYGFLLSFGTEIKIIEPQRLKDELLVQIEKMKNAYSST